MSKKSTQTVGVVIEEWEAVTKNEISMHLKARSSCITSMTSTAAAVVVEEWEAFNNNKISMHLKFRSSCFRGLRCVRAKRFWQAPAEYTMRETNKHRNVSLGRQIYSSRHDTCTIGN